MTAFTPLPFRPRAVIFDMDGLMLDSERAITACLAQAADEQGLTIEPAFWLQMVGTGDVACRLLLGERVGDAAADRMLARAQLLYDAVAERGIPHRPGIIALLEYLVAIGMPRAVATSTQRPLALRKLQAADLLWRFDAVCTASDVRHPKPAPDIYLLAAQSLGVDPAHCLVLEDSPTGVRAALAAGMTPIQIPDLLEPDANVRALGHRIMPSLSDAQRLLEAQLSG
ncbi:HAD family hydrolase [Xanthomonas vesicatoria]|uniref:HAD family phosphatase n=1 Tax=Xanthomonas vesicatoria TaxID=56460 RepID=A0AAJ0IYW5_9XANT|nr:HAD family phosphatase [Xanthomonas vesicatoria]APO95235.1 hydrolase [Xanthomonas vesicatoria]KHM94478.1 hydrolase [Xanthomonas vesicatoria]KHM94524.1 hydrolase [Xanthomonas vesicatoria]MCC8624129.1 HAD family phosphatase [Xanthomonas vesicatoria]MCC8695928.1 HAD family phosphatase [Xanthomonas vesicatoria]